MVPVTPDPLITAGPSAPRLRFSVVIPVYRSAGVVEQTLDRTVAFFEGHGLDYQVVAVDDGSPDATWPILARKASENPRILAIRLMRNYGQHTAVLCGLRHSVGDWVITMDDDLQNPPEEIGRLLETAREGAYDLVVARFRSKRHSLPRRLGSRVVSWLNERVFAKPKDFTVTNFRMIRRDVVDRICAHRTPYPYVTGLALLYSARRANVLVDHQERSEGRSGYSLGKIAALVLAILFNYSAFPLQAVAMAGLVLSATSFLFGAVFLVRGLVHESAVPGWTSLVTLVSFFDGFIFLLLSMLGQYVVRLQLQLSVPHPYAVAEVVGREP